MNKIIEEDVQTILKENLPWEKLKNKTIMITGSNGFIAMWIIRILEALGIKIIKLTHDNSNIYKEIKISESIDYILHAASYASPVIFKIDPVGTMLPNILGTYNLLELAKEKNAEFIFFSTSGVYGWHKPEDYPLSEKDFGSLDCAKLENCYLESKRCGEMLCMTYQNQYNVPVKILRLGICYGLGLKLNNDGRLMNTFIEKILAKKNLTVYNEHVYRSFMYITDVLIAIFYILFKDEGIYNIAADKEISILDFARLFSYLYPESKVIHLARTDRLSVDFSRTWMDCSKLKKLGWEQKISLGEGIKRTIKGYKENGTFK